MTVWLEEGRATAHAGECETSRDGGPRFATLPAAPPTLARAARAALEPVLSLFGAATGASTALILRHPPITIVANQAGVPIATERLQRVEAALAERDDDSPLETEYADAAIFVPTGSFGRAALVVDHARDVGRPLPADAVRGLITACVACLELFASRQVVTENLLHETLTELADAAGYGRRDEHEGFAAVEQCGTSRSIAAASLETLFGHVTLARSLATNLLAFYAPQVDGAVPTRRSGRIHARQIAEDVCRALTPRAAVKGLELRNAVPVELQIIGERLEVMQILQNVVSNAIGYSHGRSELSKEKLIRISGRVYDPGFSARCIVIEVTNYGVGILPDEVPQIGEYGFRGRLARRKQRMGHGIGMFVAQSLARAQGGFVRIESRCLSPSSDAAETGAEDATYRTTCEVVLQGTHVG